MSAALEIDRPTTARRIGPKGAPVVGIAHELRKDPLNYFVGLMRDYGEFVDFRIGMAPIIMLNGPDAVKHILQDHYEDYPKSRFCRPFKPILGRSIFTSTGETWLSQRRTASPCFGGARFQFMAERIVGATRKMLDRWDQFDRGGEPVEIVHEMMRLTLDGVTQALLDMDFIENYEEVHDALTVILRETEKRVWSVAPPPDWLALMTRPRYRRAVETIDRVVRGIIDERRRNPRDSGGLLTTLIDAHDAEGSGDEGPLKDQVVAMIATGHESTACALAWTFYMITQHADVRERVYAEVDEVAKRPRYSYFPFGGGPRVCLGNRFAMMEAKIMMAMVIQRYRLSVLPGQEIIAEPMITLRPRNGIQMGLERRSAP